MKNISFLINNLIAHRGFFDNENGIPENSLLAFEKAIRNNYIIELDLHLLKDGRVVVFHDNNLKRMTGLDCKIKDCSYNEIKKLRLLNTNEKIPLFEEVLSLVSGKVTILIELKYDVKVGKLENKVLEILKKYNGNYAIQSFNFRSVMWLKKNANEIVKGQLVNNFFHEIFAIISQPDFVSYNINYIDRKISKNTKEQVCIGWTIKNSQMYAKYVEFCDNLICEKFDFLD